MLKIITIALALVAGSTTRGATPEQMQDLAALANAVAQLRVLQAKFQKFPHLQESNARRVVPDAFAPLVGSSETVTETLNKAVAAGLFVPEGEEANFESNTAFWTQQVPMVAISYMFAKSDQHVTDTELRIFMRMLPGPTKDPLTNLNMFNGAIRILEGELDSRTFGVATVAQAATLQDILVRGEIEAAVMETRGEAGPMLRELERAAADLGFIGALDRPLEDLAQTLTAEKLTDTVDPDIDTWRTMHRSIRNMLGQNIIDSQSVNEWQVFTDPETGEQFFGPPPVALYDPTVMQPEDDVALPQPSATQPQQPQALPASTQRPSPLQSDLLEFLRPTLGNNP